MKLEKYHILTQYTVLYNVYLYSLGNETEIINHSLNNKCRTFRVVYFHQNLMG